MLRGLREEDVLIVVGFSFHNHAGVF